VFTVIDWQTIGLSPTDDVKAVGAEVSAILEDAGLVVASKLLSGYDDKEGEVKGVPKQAIGSRRTGGGAGQDALELVVRLWPLFLDGYVGAMSQDAWEFTKRGVKASLHALFKRHAAKVFIQVADQDTSGLNDDHYYEFDASDAADIDRAVDEMAENELHFDIEERVTSITSIWDAKAKRWRPKEKIKRVRRVKGLG
jgi:hypothetical protein